jgi:hypothetical protein
MEGIGYWIFLIILYGLSTYIRRRQRQRAREALEREEQSKGEEDQPQQDWKRSDIFRELFGGSEPGPEPVSAVPEDTNIFDWDQKEEPAYTIPPEPEPEPEPVTEPVRREPTAREAARSARRKHVSYDSKIEKEIKLPILESLKPRLKRKSSLQEAIIIREIIEKPLALRRKSR